MTWLTEKLHEWTSVFFTTTTTTKQTNNKKTTPNKQTKKATARLGEKERGEKTK